jgi:preprotein translocase subunit YajC
MFVTPAYAQGIGGTSPDMLISILPFVLIFVIMYFLIIRPQRTQRGEMLAAVRRGDTVVTGGGFVGKVTKVIDDNELEIDLGGGTKVTALRSSPMCASRANRSRTNAKKFVGGTIRAGSDERIHMSFIWRLRDSHVASCCRDGHLRPVEPDRPTKLSPAGRGAKQANSIASTFFFGWIEDQEACADRTRRRPDSANACRLRTRRFSRAASADNRSGKHGCCQGHAQGPY